MVCGAAWSAPTPPPTWRYSVERDAMRGTSQTTACIRASTRVSLPAPYRTQAPLLCVRGDTVFMTLPAGGQFLTTDDGKVSVDGGEVDTFEMTGPSDGSYDTIFFDRQAGPESIAGFRQADYEKAVAALPPLASQIRSGRRVIVEVAFYRAGRQQVTFDVAGLK